MGVSVKHSHTEKWFSDNCCDQEWQLSEGLKNMTDLRERLKISHERLDEINAFLSSTAA